jgi:SynChlorMet cassette radical SAM/SPASM protein ScmF
MVQLAENTGADSVKFNIVQPSGRAQEGVRSPSIQDLIALGRYVDTELARRTSVRLFFDLPPAFRPLSRIARQDGCSMCGILGIIGVLPDGHYALCGIGEHVPELVFGSVETDSLGKVWNENKFLRTLRRGLPSRLSGVCSRCLMKEQCLGSCIAQNYHRTGNAWAPFRFCQQAEDIGLFPQSRLSELAAECSG